MFDLETRALVVVPHEDDEALGCGGTISKIVGQGGQVWVLVMALRENDVKYGHVENGEYHAYKGAMRHTEFTDVRNLLGFESIYACDLVKIDLEQEEQYGLVFGFMIHRLDQVPQELLVLSIERAIELVEPTVVFGPSRYDRDADHVAVNKALWAACRPHYFGGTVLEYQTRPVLDSRPHVYIDITEHMERKLEACAVYVTQMGDERHLYSLAAVRDMAAVYGREISVDRAEAFSGRVVF